MNERYGKAAARDDDDDEHGRSYLLNFLRVMVSSFDEIGHKVLLFGLPDGQGFDTRGDIPFNRPKSMILKHCTDP